MTKEEFREKERIRHREYYYRNREKELAYYRNRRLNNGEAIRQKDAVYRAAHRKTLSTQARERYHKDGELNRARKRLRYKANKAEMRAYQIAYLQKYYATKIRPKALQRYKRYRTTHPEKASMDRVIRHARKSAVKVDSHATVFIRFVRSRKTIACYYCGTQTTGRKAHIDHIVALSKLGNHTSDNLCASCPTCNLSKNSRSLTEWAPGNQPLLNL